MVNKEKMRMRQRVEAVDYPTTSDDKLLIIIVILFIAEQVPKSPTL